MDAAKGDAGGRDYKAVEEVAALIKNAQTARRSAVPSQRPPAG
jgi:hypothetical protein